MDLICGVLVFECNKTNIKGVLIIELLTNKPPWKDHENMEIVKMVAYEGKHHPIPTGTPPLYVEILKVSPNRYMTQ